VQVSVNILLNKKGKERKRFAAPGPVFICSQIQVNISAKSRKRSFFSFLKNPENVVGLEKIKKGSE